MIRNIHGQMKNFHIAIIGGGVIGSAIAWELSKYKLNVVVFEKGSDVASETSKANSGVIHSGINSPPSSLKARFCIEGNTMLRPLADKLGFTLKWIGKYVIAKNENEVQELFRLKKVGVENLVPNLEIQDGKDIKKKEPNLTCHQALWVPTAGVLLPYKFTIALAENATVNNVTFLLETEVIDIQKKDNFLIKTNKGNFQSKLLINAAGLNCRKIVSMLEKPDFNVYPCRGEYLVLDKSYSNLINSMIYPIPPKKLGVLGVHITPTIEGNILIGPSAEFIDNADDKITTHEMMRKLIFEAKEIIPAIPEKAVIAAYSGIRCKLASPDEGGWADYRIEESKQTPGLINLLGIESPGLTSAPAIAKEIVKMISKYIELKTKNNHKTIKFMNKRFSEMNSKEQSDLIKKDNRWGRIVCRCEHITEAEIINALSNHLDSRTLSSVKFRARAGMGRCRGGFCTQHIIRIMEDNFGIHINDIKLKSPESNLFMGRNREVSDDKH
jgi:glycerol-3-phosphate dehydrogenase